MARSKVTIESIRDDFEAARYILGEDADLLPMQGDESKVVLFREGSTTVHSCAQLQKNLQFILTIFPSEDEPKAEAAEAAEAE